MSERRAPSARQWAGFALAIVIGTVGGYLFSVVSMPLPWMLGAMTATTIAALARLPVAGIQRARLPMTGIIGVLLGSNVTGEVVRNAANWIPSLAALFVFLALCAVLNGIYYFYVARLDADTAFFAGMPSGLIEMVAMGAEKGADERVIALVHSCRIFLVVMMLPSVILFAADAAGPALTAGLGVPAGDFSLVSLAWLAGVALVGMLAGRLLRLPAATLTGPLLVSALVHSTGLTDFRPPGAIVIVAQIVLGTLIGCRFTAFSTRQAIKVMLLTAGSTIMLLALTLVAGWSLGPLLGIRPEAIVLAFSPGGLTEMSLVALSLQVDASFVALHHIVRFTMVMATAGLAYAGFRRVTTARRTPEG